MTEIALLDCVEHETGPNPTAAVIWIHGLGADGHDFAPIVPELGLTGSPAIRFVFPHAQVRPVTINGGMSMRAWYDVFPPGPNGKRPEDAAGLHASQAAIEALIARENARGIPNSRIVLAGFSQGCAMTLQTGLRQAQPLAGLLALSGYLPLADSVAAERSDASLSSPIFMAHGVSDPVIVLARAEESRDALKALGYDVRWHTYPMPHSVCAPEIDAIGAFLRSVLS